MDPLSTISRLGSGRLLDELNDAIVATAAEVVETGKPGTITLTLKVSNKGQGDQLVTIDEVVARKSPKRDPKGAIFYAIDGALHREDPRQVRMQFRMVDQETGEVKSVDFQREERTV